MLPSTQEKKSTRPNENFTFSAIIRYERQETKPNKGTHNEDYHHRQDHQEDQLRYAPPGPAPCNRQGSCSAHR